MSTNTDILDALRDLIDAMHTQARELERLTAHVKQQTVALPYTSHLSVVASELSELQVRTKALAGAGSAR
jgi:hypothetical protein